MKHRSFRSFLQDVLIDIGFEAHGQTYWYKRDKRSLIVVNLQKSAFGAGVYLNFGLRLSKSVPKYPKEYECDVFGRNPALSQAEFSQFQAYLNEVKKVCAEDMVQVKLRLTIMKQIDCLVKWQQDLPKLCRRLESKQPLEMIVDRSALGI